MSSAKTSVAVRARPFVCSAAALLALAAAAREPKARVMFWYDTEDYTCPAADEGTRFHAQALTDCGLRGNFNLVGFYVQRLVELGRYDIIGALKGHCLGSQTLYHSLHPTICEYTDLADWEAAYRRCLTEEAQCVGMLRATFGLDRIKLFVVPGPSVSPVSMYVYSDMGVKFFGGGIDLFSTNDYQRLAWYANMLHVPYHGCYDMCPEKVFDNDTLAKRDLTVIAAHPNRIVTAQFWDGVNYRTANHVAWRQWKEPPLHSAETTAALKRGWTEMYRRIASDRRLAVVTCDDLEKELKPRVAIARRDVPMLLAHLEKGLEPVEAPASWSVSDVFQAAVAFLRGADSYLPAKSWGFLEKPAGVMAPVTLRREDVVAAAKSINADYFLPPQIAVGDVRVGPADFLIAMLKLLATDAPTVTVGPRDQVGPIAKHLPLLENFRLGHHNWCIFSDDFKDRYLTDRLRWQFWTLRYED